MSIIELSMIIIAVFFIISAFFDSFETGLAATTAVIVLGSFINIFSYSIASSMNAKIVSEAPLAGEAKIIENTLVVVSKGKISEFTEYKDIKNWENGAIPVEIKTFKENWFGPDYHNTEVKIKFYER